MYQYRWRCCWSTHNNKSFSLKENLWRSISEKVKHKALSICKMMDSDWIGKMDIAVANLSKHHQTSETSFWLKKKSCIYGVSARYFQLFLILAMEHQETGSFDLRFLNFLLSFHVCKRTCARWPKPSWSHRKCKAKKAPQGIKNDDIQTEKKEFCGSSV